jgi:hypothetical protein
LIALISIKEPPVLVISKTQKTVWEPVVFFGCIFTLQQHKKNQCKVCKKGFVVLQKSPYFDGKKFEVAILRHFGPLEIRLQKQSYWMRAINWTHGV